MDPILQRISDIGIVPVIAIEEAERAPDLARALAAGGLPAAEITFRTAAGEEAIRQIARSCPQVLVGAGTVLSLDQCDRAIDAGAKFVVSPGYDDAVVRRCLERGVPVLPGCVTPSDMLRALKAGLEVVKFFPAEQSGGAAYLRSLAPALPLRFMPTGGVNSKNLMDYLSFPRVAACGGTWMVKKELIRDCLWEEITALCREAVGIMLGLQLHHVALPRTQGAEEGLRALAGALDLPCRAEGNSLFAGTMLECSPSPVPGERGCLAVAANSVDRAICHLGLRGVSFDETTREQGADGRTTAVCLRETFGGFAVRLIQR